ncbi:hypothetical protein K1T71_008359 [Dendrolimus kikuchii]|uniref:Uncharacterized protein n=1 Tax=Dendrolimus kikuchii TaxID=765133 RepID=A0ACC1CXA3_9NEOP|nr:hypothetical protein K1T71_008359 [Dendrolimus kikuchii]
MLRSADSLACIYPLGHTAVHRKSRGAGRRVIKMRLFALMLICAVLFLSHAEPEPKKYKIEVKDKKTNSTLTDEERKFLREVEAKFGIKPDKDSKDEVTTNFKPSNLTTEKTPFPAVIAIEIVNDTDTKTKGKRTIDANLGYGFKTNNGYMYSYFGKSGQDEGKFMIYPYSQEDIPTLTHQNLQHNLHFQSSGPKFDLSKTHVEIQPSRAFELVAEQDEKADYQYKKPMATYNSVKGLVSPSPTYSQLEQAHNSLQLPKPTTLFTTYNGASFSGLTNQFPTVMPNYFVDPSQLLNRPEFQGAGLTSDHLNSLHDSKVEPRVVPVLVLRIPSSSLKNPTAELFANLPDNYPLSRYLNSVNLQELVNEYFKKIGHTNIPSHVMTYKEGLPTIPTRSSIPSLSNLEPQHYAAPYVQPSYTHADYSGVQYSAVQPVMARYPSSYMRHHYVSPNGHSLYRHPMHQQKFEYRYQHHPKYPMPTQTYYIHPQYHQQNHHIAAEQTENTHPIQSHDHSVQNTAPEIQEQYETPSHEYIPSQAQTEDPTKNEHTAYTYSVQEENTATIAPEYQLTPVPVDYGSSKDNAESQQYYTVPQTVQNEGVSVYSHGESSGRNYQPQSDLSATHGYTYPKPGEEGSTNEDLPISENYPSKDHTVATVFPVSYKNKISGSGAIQTVSYVTPMPYRSKFQSSFNIMVPQTFLYSPSTEKVSYVHSIPSSNSHMSNHKDNPEHEYTVSHHYVPPISRQKPPPFPRNYHSHPKRMVRPEKRPDNGMHLTLKKINIKKEVKSS